MRSCGIYALGQEKLLMTKHLLLLSSFTDLPPSEAQADPWLRMSTVPMSLSVPKPLMHVGLAHPCGAAMRIYVIK